jgi:hypothetical protein
MTGSCNSKEGTHDPQWATRIPVVYLAIATFPDIAYRQRYANGPGQCDVLARSPAAQMDYR